MKKLLFMIMILLLTPVYIFIKIAKFVIEALTEMTQPFADAMSDFVDNMCVFWKKIFKFKEEN